MGKALKGFEGKGILGLQEARGVRKEGGKGTGFPSSLTHSLVPEFHSFITKYLVASSLRVIDKISLALCLVVGFSTVCYTKL